MTATATALSGRTGLQMRLAATVQNPATTAAADVTGTTGRKICLG